MQQRDYIQRLIEQVAEALAKILGLSAQHRDQDAVREAERALASVSGFPLQMLLRLGARGIVQTIGAPRAQLVARLLEGMIAPLNAVGRGDDALSAQRLADSLQALINSQPH